MSDPVSALSNPSFDGLVSIAEVGPRGMITLRGDLSAAAVAKAVKSVVGTKIPAQREIIINGDMSAAWMSPDELLLQLPHGQAPGAVAAAEKSLDKAHSLVVDVSEARAVFRVNGPMVRDVLAKVFPVDFHPESFPIGQIRRSHLTQVPAAVWFVDDETAEIVCFRSVAQYVFDVLRAAAAAGSEVGAFA